MTRRAPWPITVGALTTLVLVNCSGDTGGGTPSDTTPPAAPSMIMAVLAEPQVVAVTWQDNSSNEKGFLIERQAGAGEFKEIGRTAANVLEYRDATVSRGRSYLYRVAALDHRDMGTEFSEDTMVAVPD